MRSAKTKFSTIRFSGLLLAITVLLTSCGGAFESTQVDSVALPSPQTAVVDTTLLAEANAYGSLARLPQATSTAQPLTETAFMDWAQTAYPQFFPGVSQDQVSFPFIYRYYPSTRNYLAVVNGKVYILGPVSGGALALVGNLSDFGCRVGQQYCGAADTSSTGSALAEINEMLRNWDLVYANEVPRDGAVALSYSDACWLDDGQDKAWVLRGWSQDEDFFRSYNQYRVGSVRSNLTLESVREETNADGTVTKYATVRYDITYTDGTKAIQARNDLVYGNSKALCAARGIVGNGENRPAWRFSGNGRQVETNVTPVNVRFINYSIATGASKNATTRSNRIELNIYDYRSLGYTYAVVTGPALPATGVKLLFPPVLRDALELQSKTGNYLNFTSREGVRMCSYRNASNASQWDADRADCAQYGASGNSWTMGDATIANTLLANGTYTFKIYIDDGWKTPGGHLTKTPALTYTDVLPGKPFNSTFSDGSYPSVQADASTLLGALNAAKGSGGTLPVSLLPTTPPAGSRSIGYRTLWMYSQGPSGASGWPKYRQIVRQYPPDGATGATVQVLGKLPSMSSVDYVEVGLNTTDRNGLFVTTIIYWD